MSLKTTFSIIICCLLLFGFRLNAQDAPLTRQAINAQVETHLFETNTTYSWEYADDHMIWSALQLGDSLVSIGYKPTNIDRIKPIMHEIDVNDTAWKAARERIINYVLQRTEEQYGPRYSRAYLMPFGEEHPLPYINIRIFNKAIIKEVRQLAEVRYFDVMTYQMEETSDIARSGAGCTPYDETISSADYTVITPAATQSWHHADNTIDLAWASSNKGEGIWIAVIDTGASATQDKLNSEFDEGESTGRTVEHQGFYNNDGWEDDCGHGTAMSGLAAAPRGFDDTPAGVAYKANLVTYRGTDDVVLDEALELTGVSNSLYHAADDSRIHIISMSLGYVFSSSQVSDAIIYANNLDKIILAAAGTSTTFTNWYGVIWPADMDETLAITGVNNASNRERCDICHEGSEVDFVVCMEKASSTTHGITIGIPDNARGYVGGSSCATASFAGIAALVWGNNPSWTKGQVINRLIQTADYYPNRDSNFGWGKVDVNQAVIPSPNVPCASGASNEVEIEITNISFPAFDEGFGSDNEWVIKLDGAAYFFNVDEGGQSGNPASFINTGICGSIPMTAFLGTTSCGQSSLSLNIETHEDDAVSSDCNFSDNGFFGNSDDALATETVSVDFTTNTFAHYNSTVGDYFVFTFAPTCVPLSTAASGTINGPSDLCQNQASDIITFQGAGSVAPYTIRYTINGGSVQSITTTGNSATISQSTITAGTFSYDIVDITDANGCLTVQTGNHTVTVHPEFVVSISNDSPVCLGEAVTVSVLPAGESQYIFFLDGNANGSYEIGEELQIGTTNTYTSTTFGNNDMVGAVVSNTNGCLVNSPMASIQVLAVNDPACCPQAATASISGTNDLCQFQSSQFISFQGSGSIAPYTIRYTLNGGALQSLTTGANDIATVIQTATTQGIYTYDLVDITDANGCATIQTASHTVTVHPSFSASLSDDSPTCVGEPVTLTALPTGQTEYLFYLDNNLNGTYDSGEELQIGTTNTYTGSTFNDNDLIGAVVTSTDNCVVSLQTLIDILPSTDPSCCPASHVLIGQETGLASYETSGTISSTQLITSSATVTYDAAVSIDLENGFQVELGAVFEAFIDGCN